MSFIIVLISHKNDEIKTHLKRGPFGLILLTPKRIRFWIRNKKSRVFLLPIKTIRKLKLKFPSQNLFPNFKFNLIRKTLWFRKTEIYI